MFELVEVDNKSSAGFRYIGVMDFFVYNGVKFMFADLVSSAVSSIEHYEGHLTVITRNSVYKFKKVDNV